MVTEQTRSENQIGVMMIRPKQNSIHAMISHATLEHEVKLPGKEVDGVTLFQERESALACNAARQLDRTELGFL
jgi:hypothetical protein